MYSHMYKNYDLALIHCFKALSNNWFECMFEIFRNVDIYSFFVNFHFNISFQILFDETDISFKISNSICCTITMIVQEFERGPFRGLLSSKK